MRASLTKRLWLGAAAMAIFIGTLFAALLLQPKDPHDRGKIGLDFIAFYTAGHFVREGRSADLYNVHKVQVYQRQLAKENGVDLGNAVGPWWNPPFYAWVFVPIAKFSYRQALSIWLLVNIGAAIAAMALLGRIVVKSLPESERGFVKSARHWALVPVVICLSVPFIHALTHAQNTCTSLLIVTIAVCLWRKNRGVLAGMATGLMFYKPQLGAVLSAVLVLNIGWRAIVGLAIAGTILLLASLAFPTGIDDFIHQMPKNLHFVQCEVPYLWDRHVTFKAFWRLLLQGYPAGEPLPIVTILSTICSAAVGAGLARAIWRAWQNSDGAASLHPGHRISSAVRRDRLIAATIFATPLLMPFYFDYDQLLLAIPAVLFAAEMMKRDRSVSLPASDAWLMRIWPVQYAWLTINPDIAELTHLNLGVPLLAAVGGLLIVRAARENDAAAISEYSPGERRGLATA